MIGIVIFTGTALILSIILAFISTKFSVGFNLEEVYQNLLPGYNCGACGFDTCLGMAEKMVEDPMNYKRCKPLRGEKLKEMEAYLRKNNILKD